jgi:2-oxoglutarate ferredoxin oxidoreductase subunit gamma
MTQKIILSGFGGQGILSAGLMLAESAVREGYEATYYPTYGAEMRGGTANCHVILSKNFISSPIIGQADTLFALNAASLAKFAPRVRKDGIVIVNSSVVTGKVEVPGCRVVTIPVEELALEKLNDSRVANVIMIGAFAKLVDFLKFDELKAAIAEKFARKGKQLIELNFRALEMGYHYAE